MYRKWTSYVSPSRNRLRTTMKIETRVHAGLVCLVLLSSVQVSALDCNFLKHRQKVFNLQSLELWREMSTTFSPECLKKPTTFNFPTKILEIRESQPATEAIYEILRGFFHILSNDSLKTVWKATHRERSLQMLHAHTKVLKSCLEGKKSTPGKLEERRNKLELKKYFRRIRTFLRVNGGSTCCWECLQHEVQAGLMHVDILTKRMRR
uniref:LOW QUALITY PROTEIN: interferon beta-like n=1 Tax=Podarcis muralis TaxID=64176 RepID=UPI00109F3A72|nr:LOW QUALITY PROTEIN: interferon beta-like [Podarcis muralis]